MVTINRKLYPFNTRHDPIRSNLLMHTVDEGSGPPVVCVHGNPTWSFYYRNLILRLRDRYRMIVPDHIGCGLSDRPPESRYRYTLASRIEDLETLLTKLIPGEPYRMVVHDWGGMIGLGAALRDPSRLQQLVILNTAGFLLPETRHFHLLLRFARTDAGGLLIRRFNAFTRGALRWGSLRKPMDPDVRKNYLAPYKTYADSLAVHRFVQDIPVKPDDAAYDATLYVDQHLNALKDIPKLIIWGRNDFIFDDAFLDEWRRRCPEARFEVMESAGHLVLEDEPERACSLIEEFFGQPGDCHGT